MIKLKNEVQALFTDAGLKDFTVGRGMKNYLAIVGICGNPLVYITNYGISTKLTKEERNILTNIYIIPTLNKTKSTIQAMLKHKNEADQLHEKVNIFIKEHAVDNFIIKTGRNFNRTTHYDINIESKTENKNGYTTLCISVDADHPFINIETNYNTVKEIETNIPTIKKLVAIIKDLQKLEKERVLHEISLKDLKTSLQKTCTI